MSSIDKPKDGSKPSRILVHLGSQNLASEILSQARQLRFSDDQDIRLNIYLSRDMSPEESRLAFEERVRRRSKTSSPPSSNQENGGGRRDQITAHVVPPLLPQDIYRPVSTIPSTSVPIITDSSQFPPLCSQGINSIVYSGPQPLYEAHVWTPAGSSANRGPGDYRQGGYVHQPPVYSNNGGHVSTFPSSSQQHPGIPGSHNASTMPTGMFHAPIIHMPPPMQHQLESSSISSDSYIPHPSQFVSSVAVPMPPSSIAQHWTDCNPPKVWIIMLLVLTLGRPGGVDTTPLAFFPCNFFDYSNRKNRLRVSVTRDGRHILAYVTSSWRCHVTHVMTSYVHDSGQNTLFFTIVC